MKIRKFVWLFLYMIPLLPCVSYVMVARRTDLEPFMQWYNEMFSLTCPDMLESLFDGLLSMFGFISTSAEYIFSQTLFTYYFFLMFIQLCVEFILLVPTLIKKWLDRRLER